MTLENNIFEFFQFKKFGKINPAVQITVIAALYVGTVLFYYKQFKLTGKMDGYTPGVSLLFVPIYEELIFRGVLLKFLEKYYGRVVAVAGSSVLFGLWHLKNIFWLSHPDLIHQILFTTAIFGPIMALLTLKTRSLWPAVILHYLNNFPLW